jgi:hypothetical protein
LFFHKVKPAAFRPVKTPSPLAEMEILIKKSEK